MKGYPLWCLCFYHLYIAKKRPLCLFVKSPLGVVDITWFWKYTGRSIYNFTAFVQFPVMPIIFHIQMFKSKILLLFSLFDLFLHIFVIQDTRNTSLQWYLGDHYLKYSIPHTPFVSAFSGSKLNYIYNIWYVKYLYL